MAKTTKILLLLVLSILVVADNAAATQLSPDAEKAIVDINLELPKVIDAVVSAAPPAKQKETMHAALKHLETIKSEIAEAKESGDEKKIIRIFITVKMAASMIAAAPPDRKLKVMEDGFNSVAAPSAHDDCPNGDRAYCETHSRIRKAVDGVIAAAPADFKMSEEVKVAVFQKVIYPATATINKAYADGDKKKIAQVLAAYSKAADEVIAAARADKFNVMEKTFSAITASAGKDD